MSFPDSKIYYKKTTWNTKTSFSKCNSNQEHLSVILMYINSQNTAVYTAVYIHKYN